jgi:hypothetical protein
MTVVGGTIPFSWPCFRCRREIRSFSE